MYIITLRKQNDYLFTIIQNIHFVFEACYFAVDIGGPFSLFRHVLGVIGLTFTWAWAGFA